MKSLVHSSSHIGHRIQEYRNCLLSIEAAEAQFFAVADADGERIEALYEANYQEAVQKLRSAVDLFYDNKMRQRGTVEPTVAEYKTALQAIARWLTPVQVSLLKAHHHAKGYECPLERLLSISRMQSSTQLLFIYAGIARRLSDALNYIPCLPGLRIDPIVAVLIAPTGIFSSTQGERNTLQLNPNVGQVLDIMDGY